MATGGKRRVPSELSENQKKQARQESRVVTDEAIAALPLLQITHILPATSRPIIFTNPITVPDSGIVTTGDLRSVSPIASNATGVWVRVDIPAVGTSERPIWIDSAGVTEDNANSHLMYSDPTVARSQEFMVALGTGGAIQMSSGSGLNTAGVVVRVMGYWT